MEHTSLATHFKFLESTAVALSIHERMQLDLSLAQLCDQMQFEHMHFWGRITGKLQRLITAQVSTRTTTLLLV